MAEILQIKVIVGSNPYAENSATANRLCSLLEGLSNLDTKIEIYIFNGYLSAAEKEKFKLSGKCGKIDYKYFNPIILNSYLGKRFYLYFAHHIFHFFLKRKLIKLLTACKAIIWTENSYFGLKLAFDLRKLDSSKYLFIEINEFLGIHKINKGNFMQRLQSDKRQKFFEEKAFHIYNGMALMTKTLLKHYEVFEEPRPKLLHLPMTVDLNRFDNIFNSQTGFEKPYIAFVGVMNDFKDGVSILIKAFADISNTFPQYKLYLIGAWNYDTPIHKKLILSLGLENKVFWRGEYKRDQIPDIIQNAQLLVLPRPDSSQAQGGFPTKLGEYLATANPVCVTFVGEIPDYLVDGESAYFAEPGSVDSFSKTLFRALSNPEEATQVGKIGRKVAETHFNKDIQSKLLYDFLKPLTKK